MTQALVKIQAAWLAPQAPGCRVPDCMETATLAIIGMVVSYTNGFVVEPPPIPVCAEHARAWGQETMDGERAQGMQS